MQLKLLNFYKMIANIANNLVGAFVPLIIYEATQSLLYACFFLMGCNLVKLFTNLFLHKYIQRSPEVFLLSRFFTLGAYCLCLSMISNNLVLFAILGAVTLGVDTEFKTLANETLFNYSSSAKVDSKSIGITRVFEQLGVFAGIIVGGLLLDVSQTVVYILAIVLYFVAIIPLFVYYLKNKKKKTFNAEYVSNATMYLSKNNNETKSLQYIGTIMLGCYGLIYLLYSLCDIVPNILNLNLFAGGGISYSYASMIVLTFNIAYFIGNTIIGKLDSKYDLLKIVQVACFIISAIFITLAFINNVVIIFICFALFGLFYSFICAFMLQRLLQKSRILGISNKAFAVRDGAGVFAYSVFYGVAMLISGLDIALNWFFLVAGAMLIITGIVMPIMEERTRKMLVDYVEDNEIAVDPHQLSEEKK